jgi:hypothetical protein
MLIPSVDELNAVRSAVRREDSAILRPDNQKAFSSLVGSVRRSTHGQLSRLGPEDLALLIAVSILTCDVDCLDADLLPHCIALSGLVEAVPGRTARQRIAVDCAIAYGCGWRRTLRNTREFGLDELWERSFHLLVYQIMDAVAVANDCFTRILRPLLVDDAESSLFDDLRGEGNRWAIASVLAFRLIRPLHSVRDAAGKIFEITANQGTPEAEVAEDPQRRDFSRFRARGFELRPLPAGSRYVFDVVSGIVTSSANGRVLAAGAGGRFVTRAGDFGAIEIWFPVGSNLGSLLRLDSGSKAIVSAVAGPVTVAQWECGCGSWACPDRHRLKSWLPNEDIGLKDFVNSAINGRDFPLKPKSLIAGMYYSHVAREGWGDEGTDGESAPLPRIRRVLMIRATETVNPITHREERIEELRENFLLISSFGNFKPVRVVRCDKCGKFSPWDDAKCTCGAVTAQSDPTVVWKPVCIPPPSPPPVERTEVGVLMEEYLQKWREIVGEADQREGNADSTARGAKSKLAARNECRVIYEEARDAFKRGDLDAAADRLNYAREMGCRLPEVGE